MQADPSEASDRRGIAAGLACYTFWGLMPLLFHAAARLGAEPFEIVAWRAIWSLPLAALLVFMFGRGAGLRALAANPRNIRVLLLSSVLIATNWTVYVWAVNNGHTLSASLGYYINPLLNMMAGAMLFGERIDRTGYIAIGLATAGVIVQGLALGEFPWVALLLGASFCAYGVVRKQASADAQTGLLVESVVLLIPAVVYVLWLEHGGTGIFGRHLAPSLVLIFCGPATVIPLAAFSFAARRLPLTVLGFMQFVSPTLQFAIGLSAGEHMTPLRAASFVLIWIGVAVYAFGAQQRVRADRQLAVAKNAA
jgi:chloramphenicol-sensitive protein RarD